MAIVQGTCEKRLDDASEQILIMTKVNDDLAALVGELRNEIISLNEEMAKGRADRIAEGYKNLEAIRRQCRDQEFLDVLARNRSAD